MQCAYIRSTPATGQAQTSRRLRLPLEQARCNVTAGPRAASASPTIQSAPSWAWIGWIWELRQPMGIEYAISLQWDAQERVLLRAWCGTGKRKSVPHNTRTASIPKQRENQRGPSTDWKPSRSEFLRGNANRRLTIREKGLFVRRQHCEACGGKASYLDI